MAGVAILAVGLGVWVVTYQRVKNGADEGAVRFLKSAGKTVGAGLRKELNTGIRMVKQHKAAVETGVIDPLSPDVEAQINHLQRVWYSDGECQAAVTLFYYANSRNNLYGLGPGYKLWMVAEPGEIFPEGWKCYYDSPNAGCDAKKCGVDPIYDTVNCSKTCNNPSHAICDGTILDMAGKIGFEPSPASVPVLGSVNVTEPMDLFMTTYNPHIRPWYLNGKTSDPSWVGPYVFAGGATIGISAVVGTGGWSSVAAADYTSGSIKDVLVGLKPTKGSEVLVVTGDGLVLAGTEEGVVRSGAVVSGWEVGVMNIVEKRFGRVLPDSEVVIDAGDTGVVVVPVMVEGGLTLYLVVSTPYSDLLQTTWRTGTITLIIALSFCAVTISLLFFLLTHLLSPIVHLESLLHPSSWANLADSTPALSSRLLEVISITSSLKTMVNILLYKQFLPSGSVVGVVADPRKDIEMGDPRPLKPAVALAD
eukprot:TRINITY_DN2816_c0_g1_i1.p1 TRINITY_DN2816_c0_g1~~TRINITY_DN2816_c0_g1_i1.p1  ORF type:complete len:541 (+),score=43.47 TRINITY_DN2816_c0_g1_i1:195-1625(+)